MGGKISLKCWWDLPKLSVTVIYRDFPQTRLHHRKITWFSLRAADAEERCHGIVVTSREQSSQRFQSYLEPHCWNIIITERETELYWWFLMGSSGQEGTDQHLFLNTCPRVPSPCQAPRGHWVLRWYACPLTENVCNLATSVAPLLLGFLTAVQNWNLGWV